MLKLLVHTGTTWLLKPDHKETMDSGGIPPCTLNIGTITESPLHGTHRLQQTWNKYRGKNEPRYMTIPPHTPSGHVLVDCV